MVKDVLLFGFMMLMCLSFVSCTQRDSVILVSDAYNSSDVFIPKENLYATLILHSKRYQGTILPTNISSPNVGT